MKSFSQAQLVLGMLAIAALFTNCVSAARVVGGDGVVFHFQGKRDKDFCLISDSGLHINAHMIGQNTSPRPLNWISALAITYQQTHIYLNAFSEAIWDPFLDHLEIRIDGEELHIPAPGHKAGPLAKPGIWESADAKIHITRQRVNEARIVIDGVFDLRVRANTVEQDLWSDDNCFVHLDIEFRGLKTSSHVHGVLGQTYRPQRLLASRLRARHNSEDSSEIDSAVLGRKRGLAIAGRMTDYLSTGLWATDCKFSKFLVEAPQKNSLSQAMVKTVVGAGMTITKRSGVAAGAAAIVEDEEVNPLEGYFSENAVSVIHRSTVSSDSKVEALDVFEGMNEQPLTTLREGFVVDISTTERGASIDDSDVERIPEGASLESLMNE